MQLLSDVKATARNWAVATFRRAAFFAVMTVLMLCSGGFATAAGWAFLAERLGGVGASATLAGIFLAVAVLALVADYVRSHRKTSALKKAQSRAKPQAAPALTEVFVTGIQVGRAMGAGRK